MARQSWYPNIESAVPFSVRDTLRRILDMVYEQRDQLGPLVLWAKGNASIEVMEDPVAVTGAAVTLPRTGNWLVTGCFTIVIDGDGGQMFSGSISRRGPVPFQLAQLQAASGTTATVSQQWLLAGQQGEVVSLLIVKDGGGGTSTIDGLNTTISAAWAGE